jgi:mRNA-degrading endonuclease RelE of RelBE toxin-antitoxin system
VRVEWLLTARALARRFMTDQAGMRAIGIAVAQLSDNPYPPEAFRWGEVLRLRVGPYRIMYTVEGDLITILRVDRRAG